MRIESSDEPRHEAVFKTIQTTVGYNDEKFAIRKLKEMSHGEITNTLQSCIESFPIGTRIRAYYDDNVIDGTVRGYISFLSGIRKNNLYIGIETDTKDRIQEVPIVRDQIPFARNLGNQWILSKAKYCTSDQDIILEKLPS